MQENYELVQKGFRLLVDSMSSYIGQELNRKYKSRWWEEVLSTLNYPRELPVTGEYGDLVDSLDVANCIRLIDWRWSTDFKELLTPTCRAWARELMGVRNIVSHIGQQDLDQPMAERALDTMALLCNEIDPDGEAELRELYKTIRKRAEGNASPRILYTGIEQPASESQRGELKEGSLLQLVDTDVVQKTTLTRKVTYGGKTVVYPVYKVRLDKLYYNDQNDRIATWISRYEAENGENALSNLNIDIYNRIIENFISESNPDAIQKTQKNISLVGQREPGVTLADGRIVDGNRRFTCLRRIQREAKEPIYFETVIMDVDIRADRKQIKLLELAIQHGEEKKVDYDLIDYAVGTYRDIVQTKLLTVEEYAESTNETIADVKKRLDIAEVITEFLAYLKLPEQFHVAREYQVYSLFQEMMTPLKQLQPDEKEQLKKIAFNNALMKAIPDQRKFIRDIKALIKNNSYSDYFNEQQQIGKEIQNKYRNKSIHSKEDADSFAEENKSITSSLQFSMEKALQKLRSQQLKTKPVDNVSKCISLLMDIDSRLFSKMNDEEKEMLKEELTELTKISNRFKRML